ncbi:Fic family protein [Microbacterium sp. NPDC058389]|uniref:Fic family protein n=1 Tax=Microbacterium sp. NPDC058389 TaxID=3346475 RepID=UPI00364CA09A
MKALLTRVQRQRVATGLDGRAGLVAELARDILSDIVAGSTRIDELEKRVAAVDAAMPHLDFVLIHPFKDGNGRMARVLQSLVLAADGDISPVFFYTEEYLGRHTQANYDVVAAVGQGHWDPDSATVEQVRPWIRFILTAHLNQGMERAARIVAAGRASTARGELLEARGVDDRAMDALRRHAGHAWVNASSWTYGPLLFECVCLRGNSWQR